MSLESRKAEYNQHKIAGEDYYNTLRSQLTLDVEQGTRSIEQIVSIQSQLFNVSCNLFTGDWRSALLQASNLNTNEILTDEYLNQIKSDIQAYISENYSW